MYLKSLPNISTFNCNPPRLDRNEVIYAHTDANYFYPEHKTPYLFVANFLSKGKYILNKKPIQISDKHFYFLNVNDQLEIRFADNVPLKTFIILFADDFVSESFNYRSVSDEDHLDLPDEIKLRRKFEIPSVPFALNDRILGKIRAILQNASNKEGLETHTLELVFEFSKLHRDSIEQINRIAAVKKSTREELYRRLFLAAEFMNDNIFEQLSVEQIAKEVCLNKFHFLSNFKALYQTTPHQYFVELKLQKAVQLLKSKRYNVTDVCFMLGFESIGSFSNLFKKRFHISPSKLR